MLAFKDLDKEWDLINSAISGINNKYLDNLSSPKIIPNNTNIF